jgi:hypothetical protein
MKLSLEAHPEGYALFALIERVDFWHQGLPKCQKICALPFIAIAALALPIIALLFTGAIYAQRHLYVKDLCHSSKERIWHSTLAGVEAIPVLGTLIGCIEVAIVIFSKRATEKKYRPLWRDASYKVPHWAWISFIRKDTTLIELQNSTLGQMQGGNMASLCAAAWVGNVPLISDLLETMDNFTSLDYHSPLFYAIAGRQPEALNILVQRLPAVQTHLQRQSLARWRLRWLGDYSYPAMLGEPPARRRVMGGQTYPSVTPLWLAAQELQDTSLVKPLLLAKINIDDEQLTAQNIDQQGKDVIQSAVKETEEQNERLSTLILDKNITEHIIAFY